MIAWLFGPFWFNPLAFDHNKMKKDLHSWLRWMERKDAAALSSWESWWREEQARQRERDRRYSSSAAVMPARKLLWLTSITLLTC